jgi:hypothetical protein
VGLAYISPPGGIAARKSSSWYPIKYGRGANGSDLAYSFQVAQHIIPLPPVVTRPFSPVIVIDIWPSNPTHEVISPVVVSKKERTTWTEQNDECLRTAAQSLSARIRNDPVFQCLLGHGLIHPVSLGTPKSAFSISRDQVILIDLAPGLYQKYTAVWERSRQTESDETSGCAAFLCMVLNLKRDVIVNIYGPYLLQ